MGTFGPVRLSRPALPRTLRPAPLDPATRPRVSVVIPCFNYGRFLRESVSSALGQVGVEVDVLVVDDASTDGSGLLAQELADLDRRVRVIRHDQNQGHIATFNEGIGAAEGDYVVLLSADDRLTDGSLGRATALLEAHPDVGFAYGRASNWRGGAVADPGPVTAWSIWPRGAWLEERCRGADNVIASPEVVVRTSVQHRLGDYRDDLPHTADLEMWLRIAGVAAVGRVDGPDQALWRVHESNMSWSFDDLADLQQLEAAFDHVLVDEATGAEAPALRELVRPQLARHALHRGLHLHLRGAQEATVDDLVRFALTVWPDAEHLPDWRRLRFFRRVPRSLGRIGYGTARGLRDAVRRTVADPRVKAANRTPAGPSPADRSSR